MKGKKKSTPGGSQSQGGSSSSSRGNKHPAKGKKKSKHGGSQSQGSRGKKHAVGTSSAGTSSLQRALHGLDSPPVTNKEELEEVGGGGNELAEDTSSVKRAVTTVEEEDLEGGNNELAEDTSSSVKRAVTTEEEKDLEGGGNELAEDTSLKRAVTFAAPSNKEAFDTAGELPRAFTHPLSKKERQGRQSVLTTGRRMSLKETKNFNEFQDLISKISIEEAESWVVSQEQAIKIQTAMNQLNPIDEEKDRDALARVLNIVYKKIELPLRLKKNIDEMKSVLDDTAGVKLKKMMNSVSESCKKRSPWERVIKLMKENPEQFVALYKEFNSSASNAQWFKENICCKRAPKEVLNPVIAVQLKLLYDGSPDDYWNGYWELLKLGVQYSFPMQTLTILIDAWNDERNELTGLELEKYKYQNCPFKIACGIQTKLVEKSYDLINLLMETYMKHVPGYDPFWAVFFEQEIADEIIIHILDKTAKGSIPIACDRREKPSLLETTEKLTPLQAALLSPNRSAELAASLLEGPSTRLEGLDLSTKLELAKQAMESTALQKVLNKKITHRGMTAFLFGDLFATFMLLVLFVSATIKFFEGVGLSPVPKTCESSYTSNYTPTGILIAVICFNFYFLLREILQMLSTGTRVDYFFDIFNLYEVTRMVLVFISAFLMMSTGDCFGEGTQGTILTTGVLVIVGLIFILRTTFLPFGTFVGGLFLILKTTLPFLIVSFLLVFAFSFIYYTLSSLDVSLCPVDGNDEFNDEFNHCTLSGSMYTSLFWFFKGPDDPTNYTAVDFIFLFLVIVVLLNVVIAIVSDAWEDGKAQSGAWFWGFRTNFLAEMAEIKALLSRVIKPIKKMMTCSNGDVDRNDYASVCCPKKMVKHIRLTTEKIRFRRMGQVHLSGIYLFQKNGKQIPTEFLTKPSGNDDTTDTDDNNTVSSLGPSARWLSQRIDKIEPIIIELEEPIPLGKIASYKICTACDNLGHDPIRWRLEWASLNMSGGELKWNFLDNRNLVDQVIPEQRSVETQHFYISMYSRMKERVAWIMQEIDALGDRTIIDHINWTVSPYEDCAYDSLYLEYAVGGSKIPDQSNPYEHAGLIPTEDYEKLCKIASFEHDWLVASRSKTDKWRKQVSVLMRFVLFCLLILLGFVSFGFFWPKRFREMILSFSSETSDDDPASKSNLYATEEKVVKTTRRQIEALEERIEHKLILITEERIGALEKKIDDKLEAILSIVSKSSE